MTYIGLLWMKDMAKQIMDRKMKSARNIKRSNEPLHGEELANFNKCVKTTKTPQLQETEQVLIDGEMKTLKISRRAMTTLTQSKLSCYQCNQDYFDDKFLNKVFCPICKEMRTEDDLIQCSTACTLIKEGPTKGGEDDIKDDPIMIDNPDMDDNQFLLTSHTVCLLKSHKPTLGEKLIESHNQAKDIPVLQTSIQYPICAEFMVKKPLKLTLRVLFLVFLTCAKFLRKRNQKLNLEEARCALTGSILIPANLDSMLPLLPNESTSLMEDKPNPDHLLGQHAQPKQRSNQLKHIKSKLFNGKIKNI
jgi:predicted Zn-ribbon and HTH transcriptional regulator